MKKKEFTPLLGDLSRLTEEQQAQYVQDACDFLGVPSNLGLVGLSFMDTGDGARQKVLYIKRGATDIIRDRRKIHVDSLDEFNGQGYVGWKAKGHDAEGRTEMAVGAVSIEGLRGAKIADAVKTAQTQSLRRMTLQFAGGGFLDESEIHETTTNINTASNLQQIARPAQPTVAPATEAGKDITSPKPEPLNSAVGAIPGIGGSPSEVVRKPRKKRTVSLDSSETIVPEPTDQPRIPTTMFPTSSQSEKLESELEPRPEPKLTIETARAAVETMKAAMAAPAVPQPTEAPKAEEKVFVGTKPTKEQSEAFRAKLSVLVNDALPRGDFRQSQGLGSKNRKLGMFVQCMFPKADIKNLSVEQQAYFLNWMDKKIEEIGVLELVKLINSKIGETEI